MSNKLLLLPNDQYGMGIKHTQAPGHVYIIDFDEGMVKIGKSINPEVRISNIERISGKTCKRIKISTPGTNYSLIESSLHVLFAEYRVKGEWFKISFSTAVKALADYEFFVVNEKNESKFNEKDWRSYLRKLGNPLYQLSGEEPLSQEEFCSLSPFYGDCGENCPRFNPEQCYWPNGFGFAL